MILIIVVIFVLLAFLIPADLLLPDGVISVEERQVSVSR